MKLQKFISSHSRSLFILSVIALIIVFTFFPHYQSSNLFFNEEKKVQGENQVAILDQFRDERPGFTAKVIELFESENINVDVHENITIDLYRKLPTLDYQVIILRTHSATRRRTESGIGKSTSLFTTEEYDSPKYPVLQTKDLVEGARVGENGEKRMFAIRPKFVRDEMEGKFENTLLLLDSCSIFNPEGNYELTKALYQTGAGAIVSWRKSVTLSHGDEGTLKFLKYILQENMVLQEAAEKVLDEVGRDPQSGGKLMVPKRSSDLRLKLVDGELILEN